MFFATFFTFFLNQFITPPKILIRNLGIGINIQISTMSMAQCESPLKLSYLYTFLSNTSFSVKLQHIDCRSSTLLEKDQ